VLVLSSLVLMLVLHGEGVLAQEAPGSSGPLLITSSVTADDLESPPAGGGGLVVRMTLSNAGETDLSGIRLRVPIPPGAEVAQSWLGQPGRGPGAHDADALIWSGLTVRAGEQVGPIAYRLVPSESSDGAVIFRQATVRPEATWASPESGTAQAQSLKLNGLWGDRELRRTVLPTGLTVFTRERPDTPSVALRLAVRAGSRDEDEVTSGGSHWLEHAYFLGTERRPTNQALFGAIASVGGQSNASTGWEATDYWHLVPSDQFDLALDVLSDMILNSTFLAEAFDRERRVVFEELKLRNDRPDIRVFDEFINLVFRVSPLRRHPAGTIESVQSIPIATILAYKDQHYVASNMAIAASGNLSHDEAVGRIERAFAGLPIGSYNERPRVSEPVQTTPRVKHVGDGTRVAEILIGWPAPGDDVPESAAMFVLQDILGATGRRLSQEIRDRRALATAVEPEYMLFYDAGAMAVSATTQPDRVDEVIGRILEQIRRLRDGEVTDDDVQTSLRAIAGRRALSEESNQGQTGRAVVEVSGWLDSFDEYVARLRQVSAADVQAVAQKYLDLANYTLVVVRS
jgi:predicted Zn-dependent peptidase